MIADIKQKFLGKIRNRLDRVLAGFKSPEQVFTEIYSTNQWGGVAGEICSGGGSTDEAVSSAYLGLMASSGLAGKTVVDLGCGDMRIGRRIMPLCESYIGVDVVQFVVERHKQEFGGTNASFRHLDITTDELPDGDVCLIRQVLQHLSNKQIARVLPKLGRYRQIFITEHLPSAALAATPNIDKPQGKGIRLEKRSGVDITCGPFHIPIPEVVTVLEVPGNPVSGGGDPGVIRTVLYTPNVSRGND